jgi:tellurite resistance protein
MPPYRLCYRHNNQISVMTKRYTRSSATTTEHMADRLDNRDEAVMQGLVTAGALVALADGRVEEVERDELLNFIDRQQLAPTIPRTDIAEVFDRRVQQLEDRDSAEVIIENLRPLVGLSLASGIAWRTGSTANCTRLGITSADAMVRQYCLASDGNVRGHYV